MKADVHTIDAKTAGSVELADHIFGLEPRVDIIHRVIQWAFGGEFQRDGASDAATGARDDGDLIFELGHKSACCRGPGAVLSMSRAVVVRADAS